MFVEITVVQV